jgi:hypothetical protein
MPSKRRVDAVCEPQTGRIVLGGRAPAASASSASAPDTGKLSIVGQLPGTRHTACDAARHELELAIVRYEAGDAAGAGSHIKRAMRLDPALKSYATRNAGPRKRNDGGVDARRYQLHLDGFSHEEIARLTPTKRGRVVKITTIETSISEAKRQERQR